MANADALSRVPIPESPPTLSDPGDLVFLINHLSHAIVTANIPPPGRIPELHA